MSSAPSRREARDEGKRRNDDRAAWLRAQLEPGEVSLAKDPHVIVNDDRIIFALRLYGTRAIPGETRETLRFAEISGWAFGRLHDERPLLRLQHTPRFREEWMPAHQFLRFRWGNATGPVTHRESTLSFNRRSNPALRVIAARLEADAVPRGDDFVIALKGTREERGGSAVLYRRGS
jgi:hypothetical protein